MQSILFKVEGQRIESTSDVVVVAKSKHEYKAVFSFSSEWEALENKVAYFKTTKLKEPVFVEMQDNECEIPVEALETPYFTVSVAAGDLRTATVCDVVVEETGYSDAAEPALSPKGRRRYADSLLLNGKQLQLTEAGMPIGDIVTIPDFNKFELWNDITLEEDATNVTMSKTDSGAPLKIKRLFILFAGSTSGSGNIILRYNSGVIFQLYKSVSGDKSNVAFWVDSEKLKDALYVSYYPSDFLINDGTPDNISMQGLVQHSKSLESTIYFKSNVTNPGTQNTATSWIFGGTSSGEFKLKAGSRILVWGVQDDD